MKLMVKHVTVNLVTHVTLLFGWSCKNKAFGIQIITGIAICIISTTNREIFMEI